MQNIYQTTEIHVHDRVVPQGNINNRFSFVFTHKINSKRQHAYLFVTVKHKTFQQTVNCIRLNEKKRKRSLPTYLYAGYTNGYTHMELHSGKWPWTASFGHIDEWATQFWLIVFSNYSLSRAISVNDLEAKFGHISYWFYINIKHPVIKRRSEHACMAVHLSLAIDRNIFQPISTERPLSRRRP